MNVTIDVDRDTLWSTIVSAFEGGSNYWIGEIEDAPPKEWKQATFGGYCDEAGEPLHSSQWWPELDDSSDWEELEKKKLYLYSSQLPFLGGSVKITEEGYDHDPRPLTGATIADALQLMHDKHSRHFSNLISENGDSITGDVLLQLAVFGRLIYG